MSGVKGRSGRKGYIEEKEVSEVIEMSLCVIRKFLLSNKIALQRKAQLAGEFVKRRVPTKVDTEDINTILFKPAPIFYNKIEVKQDKPIPQMVEDKAKINRQTSPLV